jgi:hypothetical protein
MNSFKIWTCVLLYVFTSDGYRRPCHIEGWTQQDKLNIPVYSDTLKAARTHSRQQITSNTAQRTLPNGQYCLMREGVKTKR